MGADLPPMADVENEVKLRIEAHLGLMRPGATLANFPPLTPPVANNNQPPAQLNDANNDDDDDQPLPHMV